MVSDRVRVPPYFGTSVVGAAGVVGVVGAVGVVGVVGVVGAVGVSGVVGVAAGPQAAISKDSTIKLLNASHSVFLLNSLFLLFYLNDG